MFSASESSSADAALADDTGDWRGLGEALLLHQQFERAIAAATGRNLEHAGFVAVCVAHRPNSEALQQCSPGDVLGQLLDRDAGLDRAGRSTGRARAC